MNARAARFSPIALLVAAVAATAVLALRPPEPAFAVPAEAPGKYFGASSCGGDNCHAAKAPRPKPPALQEHTTWSTVNPETQQPQDRHAYAYNRLFEEKSKEIAAALNKLEGTKAAAEESERCLRCHGVATQPYGGFAGNVAVSKRKDLQGGKFDAADGVSCDGCHGPAEKWLEAHKEADWAIKTWNEAKGDSEGLFKKWGIYYSKDLVLWANQCVRCHLAIDANLIAAKHPDLVAFELFGQSQAVPPHWRSYWTQPEGKAELPASGPFHGVRVWQTGQAVALREALAQVAGAAGASDERVRDAFDRAWGHWVVFRHAAERAAPAAAKPLKEGMDALKALVAAPKPDKAKITEAATKVEKGVAPLAKTMADAKVDLATVTELCKALANDPDAPASRRTAEQTAMGLYAIRHSFLCKTNPKDLEAETPSDEAMAAVFQMFGGLDPADAEKFKEGFLGGLARVKAVAK